MPHENVDDNATQLSISNINLAWYRVVVDTAPLPWRHRKKNNDVVVARDTHQLSGYVNIRRFAAAAAQKHPLIAVIAILFAPISIAVYMMLHHRKSS